MVCTDFTQSGAWAGEWSGLEAKHCLEIWKRILQTQKSLKDGTREMFWFEMSSNKMSPSLSNVCHLKNLHWKRFQSERLQQSRAALGAGRVFHVQLHLGAASAHFSWWRRGAGIQWGHIKHVLKGLGGDSSANNAELNLVQTFRRGETAAERQGRAALYCS